MKNFILAALTIVALCSPANAQTGQSRLTISNAWSRATATAQSVGVVYFTVTDTGAPDTLTGITTPIAAKAQLHESKMLDGVMQMRPVDSLTISKDHPISLTPGGYHVMLTGLTQSLKDGQSFPITLTFAQAGPISTTVTVKTAGASNMGSMPGMDGMKGMDMGGMTH